MCFRGRHSRTFWAEIEQACYLGRSQVLVLAAYWDDCLTTLSLHSSAANM